MKILDKDGLSYFWAKLKTLLNGKLDADAVSSTGTASTGWNNCRLSGGKIQYYNTNTTYSAATTSSAGLMSASDKTKLDGIETGAEANVQADWAQTETTADDYIKNKPTIPTPVTVDQTYNAQSANAQSGVAVAQAVSGKITATDYATETTGGTIKAWTTTDGSDTILHLATQ